MTNIPWMDDVEMQDVNPPPGLDPEVGRTGYDYNLVQASDEGAPGSNSPVTEHEDRMLDEDTQPKAPGTRRPGSDRNAGWPITNWKYLSFRPSFPVGFLLFIANTVRDHISTVRILRSSSGSLQYLTKHLSHCRTNTFWVSQTGPHQGSFSIPGLAGCSNF